MDNSVIYLHHSTEELIFKPDLVLDTLQNTTNTAELITSLHAKIQNDDTYSILNLQYKIVLMELVQASREKILYRELNKARLTMVLYELLNGRKVKMWDTFENAFLNDK